MNRYKRKYYNKVDQNKNFASLLISSTIVLVAVFLFSRNSALSEWYMIKVYPTIATILSAVSALVPFSIYDVFLILAIIYLLKLILYVIFKQTSFKDFIYSLISFATIIIAWFYFGWGISYFREDFYTRSNLEETQFSSENLKDFAYQFIEDANNSYIEFDVIEKESIKQEIERSYKQLHESLLLKYPNGSRRIKKMIFESIFTKMSISGYYGPFINEIHVNNYSLNFTYPFTLTHEMAHQFGIAKESEANLYAFIVCLNSDDERIRYSAYASTLSYLLNDVRTLLPDDYEEVLNSVKPEIIEDLQRNRKHWLSARNKALSDAQNKAYDAYLKTNKVTSGRENYSEVVGLLISSYDSFSSN